MTRVYVGGQVGITNDAEHPGRLVDLRRQLVGPVGDVRPFRGVEEPFRRDIESVGVDMGAATHACAREDEHIVEVLDPFGSRRALLRGTTRKCGRSHWLFGMSSSFQRLPDSMTPTR
jgi:hypothetical protein